MIILLEKHIKILNIQIWTKVTYKLEIIKQFLSFKEAFINNVTQVWSKIVTL